MSLAGDAKVYECMARTRSEARASFKLQLGIGRKGRLPVGLGRKGAYRGHVMGAVM